MTSVETETEVVLCDFCAQSNHYGCTGDTCQCGCTAYQYPRQAVYPLPAEPAPEVVAARQIEPQAVEEPA